MFLTSLRSSDGPGVYRTGPLNDPRSGRSACFAVIYTAGMGPGLARSRALPYYIVDIIHDCARRRRRVGGSGRLASAPRWPHVSGRSSARPGRRRCGGCGCRRETPHERASARQTQTAHPTGPNYSLRRPDLARSPRTAGLVDSLGANSRSRAQPVPAWRGGF